MSDFWNQLSKTAEVAPGRAPAFNPQLPSNYEMFTTAGNFAVAEAVAEELYARGSWFPNFWSDGGGATDDAIEAVRNAVADDYPEVFDSTVGDAIHSALTGETSRSLGIESSLTMVAEENTCRNCDKPCSGEYCSNLCEDMDKHPAPTDDYEKFTKGSSRKMASLRDDVRRAGHSIYEKRDWFDQVLAATSDSTLSYLEEQIADAQISGYGTSPAAGQLAEGVAMHIAETSDIPMYSPAERAQMDADHNRFMIDKYDRGIDGWSPGDTGTFCKRCDFRDEMHSGGPMSGAPGVCNLSYGELVTTPALTYNEYQRLTGTSSRRQASDMENSWQTDFDANRSYWSGQARAAEEAKAAERRLWDMKGQEVTVVKGRKIPIGTKGIVFYSGEGQWGWRIGFKTSDGQELWTALGNVELTSEMSSTSARTAGYDSRADWDWDAGADAAEDAFERNHDRRWSESRFPDGSGTGPHPWRESGVDGWVRRAPEVGLLGVVKRTGIPAVGAWSWSVSTTNGSPMNVTVDGGTTDTSEAAMAKADAAISAGVRTATRKTAGPMGINVGDIFYNSWGYDQTNVDFYEVVRTTNAMVEVKPIQSRVVDGGAYSQTVVAVPGSYRDMDVIIETGRTSPYGKPDRQTKMCRVNDAGGRAQLVLSSRYWAYPWDGTPLGESGPYGGH